MKSASTRHTCISFLTIAMAGLTGWLLIVISGAGTSSASGRLSQKPAAHLDIEVMPGQATKTVDLSSTDNIRVAVLGGSSIDVTTIDPSTLMFAGASAMKNRASAQSGSGSGTSDLKQAGGPKMRVTLEDANGDGKQDLVATFGVPFLSELVAGSSQAILKGRTFDGQAFEGSQWVAGTGESIIKSGSKRGLIVNAPAAQFCNSAAITINDNAAASPYPSAITVSGQTGVISNLTVSVTGFDHTFAEDVSALLVGPTGQKMILWAQASDGSGSTGVNLTFDDAATAYLPINGPIVSGTFKPTNRAGQNIFGDMNFPAPAPAATPASPYAATLASFNGTNPNGTWNLYVVDNAAGDSGDISGGWCLNITTAPSVTVCAPTLLQGSIATGDTTQVSRLFRDGVPGECVGTPKTCPGSSGSSTLRYDTYSLTNQNTSPACVTVTTTSNCGVNVFATAYLTSYTPPPGTNLCLNYLADAGLSPQGSNGVGQSFSFTVAAGATFVLVANEVAASTPCGAYSLLVEGNLCPSPCTLTCPANITHANDPNQCGAVVTYPAPTTTGTCGVIVCTPASGSFFPKGTTTVTCTSVSPSCSFTITVNDTQAPTITCPAAVTVVGTPGSGTVVVTYPPPTSGDNCPGVTSACVPASGSTFPLGTTTVTCTATDASGNTASCSFGVTAFDVCLQDDTNPANVVLINSATGDYRFCCSGTTYTGKGSVKKSGSTITLSSSTADRRVQVQVDSALKKGTAELQSPPGTSRCSITDRNTANNTCSCN
jgi:subtilisin-like proprotein convertase family protein